MEIICITTTVDNKEDAKRISSQLIAQKLAACVRFYKMNSVYNWNSKTVHEKEYKIEAKTLSKKSKMLINFIIKNHKYENPEILVIPCKSGSAKYSKWIEKNIGD